MTLKLAIDARYAQRRITGVERYAHEISKRLTLEKRFIKPEYLPGRVGGHLWEQIILPAKIQKGEFLWSPANAGPWLVRNQVVTLHDASVFDHPEWFNPTFAAWTRLSWKILARRARAILTVSEFSKHRLKLHLRLTDEKIHVVYNGVSTPFEQQSPRKMKAVKEKYGIKKPYFLFVGTMEPRKNLKVLLEAWQRFNSKSHELFLAGSIGRVFSATSPMIRSIYIADEDLPALYSGAAAFVFPSLYEGFGLPVLEAMACGVPVITSKTSAFPEIFGDAALLIDPANPEETALAMQEIIENKSLVSTLRERGLKKASSLSWEKSAAKIESIFKGMAA
ncbi:MAG: glycosyltransferase family 4 protein [Anaerolineales bacterium]|nr:glycosyltransferase family 4 protein [Anaerolineales bacterium]